jgi:hypothetical protein
MKLKPVARKYRFDEVPSERERWLALPLEVRLRAVVEMAEFWARVRLEEAQARGEEPDPPICIERIYPIAIKHPPP